MKCSRIECGNKAKLKVNILGYYDFPQELCADHALSALESMSNYQIAEVKST